MPPVQTEPTEGGPELAPLLELEVSEFAYQQGPQILGEMSLAFSPGHLMGLMGPNGCGKSTLLSLVAGELVSDTVRRTVGIREDQIAWVVQDYRSSLFAWKTALDNLILPLVLRGDRRRVAEGRASEIGVELALPADLLRHPGHLSGGELQKICVARALLEQPRLLLLDESFSAMDYKSRLVFLRLLRARLVETTTCALLVSHSAEEAFLFCDRLLLMDASGRVANEINDCQDRQHYLSNLELVHAHFLD